MKKLTIFSLLVLELTMVFFMVSPAGAGKRKKSKLSEVIERRSIDEIEQVTNYLTVRVEADPLPKGQKILKCDPTMVKVNSWLAGKMAKLSDEKLKAESDAYRANPKPYLKRIKWCADRCTCAVYNRLFAAIGAEMAANSAHKGNQEQLKKELRKRKEKARSLQCAKKLEWFCESDIHKYLKSR